MVIIDKQNFEAEVLQTDDLTLVDFWSPKCEYCKELMPDIETLSEKYKGKVKFAKLDTSENKKLAISQKVLGLPTIAFYKNGEKVAELCRSFIIDDVETKLINLLSS